MGKQGPNLSDLWEHKDDKRSGWGNKVLISGGSQVFIPVEARFLLPGGSPQAIYGTFKRAGVRQTYMVVNGKSPRAATSNTHIIHHNSDPLSRMLTRLLLQSSWTTLTVNTWPPVRSAQVYLYLFQQRCEDNTDTLYSCQKLRKKQGYFTVIRRAWQDSPVT